MAVVGCINEARRAGSAQRNPTGTMTMPPRRLPEKRPVSFDDHGGGA
jgi:hypothetical protein